MFIFIHCRHQMLRVVYYLQMMLLDQVVETNHLRIRIKTLVEELYDEYVMFFFLYGTLI